LTAGYVAWKQTRGLPYVPSPLLFEGRIYIVKDGGMISSYDAATGKAFYQQERLDAIGNYYSSPVAANGHVYVISLNGRVTVLAAGGETPQVVSQADFNERICATPALVEKALYLRTASSLYAFGR
jgi:outer membrane protein assembly factor BamB